MSKSIPSSPFDALILKNQSVLWSSPHIRNPGAETDRLSFVAQQLNFLRALYIEMQCVNHFLESFNHPVGTSSVSFEEAALEGPRPSSQVFLNYFSFINLLCQFSRGLEAHFGASGKIPNFERIRFYRNQATEHWDECVKNLGNRGFYSKLNQAPVPYIEGSVAFPDRAEILSNLKVAFKKMGAELAWDDSKIYSGIGATAEYSDSVFKSLEAIKKLNGRTDRDPALKELVTLLLTFGFPTAIVDVEVYSEALVDHVRNLLVY